MRTSVKEKSSFFVWLLLCMIGLMYVILMSKFSILRYDSFHANMFDMGINIQAIWNTIHGRILTETINMGFPVQKLWFGHWEFIFLPIALIFALIPSPDTLLVIQSLFLASGAIPIFELAQRQFKNKWLALVLSIMYLLYPALQNANLFDFHGLTLATGPLLFAFYFMVIRKRGWFYFFVFLSLICREDVSLIIIMFGFYDFLFLKNKKEGIGLFLVGSVWFLGFIFRPYLYEMLHLPPLPAVEQAPGHWAHLGSNSPIGILIAIFQKPFYVLKFLFSRDNIKYVIKLFAPVGFLSFLSPSTIWLMFPTLFINLMSNWSHTKSIEYQYTATITPFVFVSLIYGLSFLKQKLFFGEKRFGKSVFYLLFACVFGLSLLSFRFKSVVWDSYKWQVTPHDQIADSMAKSIPQRASVSAETYLGTHLSERKAIYPMTMHYMEADFVFYDFYKSNVSLYTKPGFDMSHLPPINPFILSLLKNREYGIRSFQNGIVVFRRGYNYEKGIQELCFGRKNEIKSFIRKQVTPNLLLVGNTTRPRVGIDRSILHYTFFWKKTKRDENSVLLTFVIKNGNYSASFSHHFVFGLYPYASWPVNQVIRDEIYLKIPYKMHSDHYQIFLKVKNADASNQKGSFLLYLFQD